MEATGLWSAAPQGSHSVLRELVRGVTSLQAGDAVSARRGGKNLVPQTLRLSVSPAILCKLSSFGLSFSDPSEMRASSLEPRRRRKQLTGFRELDRSCGWFLSDACSCRPLIPNANYRSDGGTSVLDIWAAACCKHLYSVPGACNYSFPPMRFMQFHLAHCHHHKIKTVVASTGTSKQHQLH